MVSSADMLNAIREISNAKQLDRAELHGLLENGIFAALAKRRVAPIPASGLVLDPTRFCVRYQGRDQQLTPTEFRMLAALTAEPGAVVRRRALVAAGWPMGAIVQENTIDSYVRRLRTKLEAVASPVRIETVRGVGYALR